MKLASLTLAVVMTCSAALPSAAFSSCLPDTQKPQINKERLDKVRDHYEHLPIEILGLGGEVKLSESFTCRCPCGFVGLVLKDSSGKKVTISFHRQNKVFTLSNDKGSFELSFRSPEESALYGFLIRHHKNLQGIKRITHPYVLLIALDQRFAYPLPTIKAH